jgi:hydrogenase maturation protein HypF
MIVPSTERSACLVRVTGLVQGVGFRPFVHRLALRHQLGGRIRNTSGDVEIVVEGNGSDIEGFLAALRVEAPPLARIDEVSVEPDEATTRTEFTIETSALEVGRRLPVAPDVATCEQCEAELFDPANRRYRYPFITCTNCGPRYTIIRGMPYDRGRTSMAAFRQCPDCLAEYRSVDDRRHHSETNSCPACGPRIWYESASTGAVTGTERALEDAARLIRSGGILALRGLGGFHLAVDATDETAVRRLRRRKRRESKPLAIMVRTEAEAQAVGFPTEIHRALLAGPEHPIVLLPANPSAGLAPSIAPGQAEIGVMLAYTPLHHLLLDLIRRPLVMTSGNRSEEPIAIDNDEARERLGTIADGWLLHDREIVARYDDSVIRVARERPIVLRRSRGYAPLPLDLPVATPAPLVAVGPELKNTFTLAQGRSAYVSQHVGDLENLETLDHFRAALAAYRALFHVEPEVAVRDLHPGYLSTRLAEELGFARVIAVQHHHAHIAAVLAEHGETAAAIGVAYDGTGYGDDGQVWGSEILIADLEGYRRFGHLRYAPLPGGDTAARNPWRAALGYSSLDPGLDPVLGSAWHAIEPAEVAIARRQIERRVNAPLASSMGRLFDAAAAVIGVRRSSSYEGQAAMELETLAGRRSGTEHSVRIERVDGRWMVDPTPLLAALAWGRRQGVGPADLAAELHDSVAAFTVFLVDRAVEETGIHTIVLSGGVWQNARLSESVRCRLVDRGLRVLLPLRLPPNDGGVSYGQAAIGAALLASGGSSFPPQP